MSHSNHPTWGFEFFDTHASIGGLCCFAQLYKPAKPLGVTCEFVQRCSASRLKGVQHVQHVQLDSLENSNRHIRPIAPGGGRGPTGCMLQAARGRLHARFLLVTAAGSEAEFAIDCRTGFRVTAESVGLAVACRQRAAGSAGKRLRVRPALCIARTVHRVPAIPAWLCGPHTRRKGAHAKSRPTGYRRR